ncbi:MAG: orotidine-5'-phosphate decarboxylase [Muribaculaceae bacterium]|nr:orotidine-5'-phosphate decarboxylase [Muribaculaceae bacterium]
MKRLELVDNIRAKHSFLCVGLDTDINKIPKHLLETQDPIFEFNKAIIDATAPYCIAYKPNTAFYEANGAEGWQSLAKTIKYIRENYPDQFIIADAKRGDIGNTSRLYARAFFENLDVDALTVAPYMGEDSVKPFLEYEGKWVILLALTSNKGAQDFELIKDRNDHNVFERVLKRSSHWGTPVNMMYVVGATQADYFKQVRALAPRSFLLVPGVGAQGGSLEEVAAAGLNDECGLIVNSSRAIIYASDGKDFASVAGIKAKEVADQMDKLLASIGF